MWAQEESDVKIPKWIKPLNAGISYSNISHIGPVLQYQVINSFLVTCKLEVNLNTGKLFVLPGLKYSFDQIDFMLKPYVELQYSTLDDILYTKLYYKDMEIKRYCTAWDYDPISGTSTCTHWKTGSTSEKTHYRGSSLFTGVEYSFYKKLLVNAGVGTSYFPKIESEDKSKFILMFEIGLYYSFSD